jgi:hypothetical protein
MSIPSENKNQVTRTREEPDPAASSPKPMLDERRKGGLRGDDKRQGDLRNEDLSQNGIINPK